MEKIEITEASPSDALGITNVLHKTWLDTYPNEELGITTEDIEESYKDAFSEERIKRLQERIFNTPENQKRLVAKINGEVVGTATAEIFDSYSELKTIYVLPEFQGRGIGKKLWAEILDFCDKNKDLIVKVATYNQNTIEFYKRVGFVDTGKRFTDERWKMKSGATIPEMEMVLKR